MNGKRNSPNRLIHEKSPYLLQHAYNPVDWYSWGHFWDSEHGGFYHTSDTNENILIRQKHAHDGVIPSGNAVAFLNLLRLARITGDTAFEEKASALSQTFSRSVKQLPSSYTFFLTALDFAVGPSFEVVLVGNKDAVHTQEMITALRSAYIPNKVVIFRADEKSPEIATISPFVSNMTSIDGNPTAYVCRNYSCTLPATDAQKMLDQLNELSEI